MNVSRFGQETAISTESLEFLKAEFVRLHKMVMDGRDASTKLASIASLFKAEGIDLPETDPPVRMAGEK